jgi:hypothetical protein
LTPPSAGYVPSLAQMMENKDSNAEENYVVSANDPPTPASPLKVGTKTRGNQRSY